MFIPKLTLMLEVISLTNITTLVSIPIHYLQVPNGPSLFVDVPKDKNNTAEVMESLLIPKGVHRVLFRTLNRDKKLTFKKEFDSSFSGFITDGAKWLVENTDIKLIVVVMAGST